MPLIHSHIGDRLRPAGDMLPELGNGLAQFFLTKPWLEQEMCQVVKRAVAIRNKLG